MVRGSGWGGGSQRVQGRYRRRGPQLRSRRGRWKLDAGHYEGRDGTGDDLIPRRQTALHLDGTIGSNRTFRSAVYRRDQNEREHAGGFARFRHRLPQGVWAGFELGGETNHGPADDPGHLSYVRIGARYELP